MSMKRSKEGGVGEEKNEGEFSGVTKERVQRKKREKVRVEESKERK